MSRQQRVRWVVSVAAVVFVLSFSVFAAPLQKKPAAKNVKATTGKSEKKKVILAKKAKPSACRKIPYTSRAELKKEKNPTKVCVVAFRGERIPSAKELQSFPNLRELSVERSPAPQVPADFGLIGAGKSLGVVRIVDSGITQLPKSFRSLALTGQLDLRGNSLTEVPRLGKKAVLDRLDLTGNAISKPSVSALAEATIGTIVLANNPIESAVIREFRKKLAGKIRVEEAALTPQVKESEAGTQAVAPLIFETGLLKLRSASPPVSPPAVSAGGGGGGSGGGGGGGGGSAPAAAVSGSSASSSAAPSVGGGGGGGGSGGGGGASAPSVVPPEPPSQLAEAPGALNQACNAKASSPCAAGLECERALCLVACRTEPYTSLSEALAESMPLRVCELNLKGSQVKKLDGIGKFTNLKALRIVEAGIDTLPGELALLTKLELLSVRDTPIATIAQGLAVMGSASAKPEIDISITGSAVLRLLPYDFGSFSKPVRNFNLSGNALEMLPTTFENLALAGESLDLGKNKLTSLPSWFEKKFKKDKPAGAFRVILTGNRLKKSDVAKFAEAVKPIIVAFLPTEEKTLGAVCDDDLDSCNEQQKLECRDGKCKPAKVTKKGSACDLAAFLECSSELRCDEKICKPARVAVGAACDAKELLFCAVGLECRENICKPPRAAKAAACNAAELLECGSGLECRNAVCSPPFVLKGAACDVTRLLECNAGFECRDSVCKHPPQERGAGCNPQEFLECGAGFECRSNICKPPRVSVRGAPCDGSLFLECTTDLECRQQKCKPPLVAKGSRCDADTLLECAADLECRDSVCKPPRIAKTRACNPAELFECVSGLECRGNICKELLRNRDQSCNPPELECASDLECRESRCQYPLAKKGQACDAQTRCESTLECRDSVCKPPLVTVAGGRCSTEDFLECGSGFACRDALCKPPVVGRRKSCDVSKFIECVNDYECRDGICKNPAAAQGKWCSTAPQDLADCKPGLECRGSICKPLPVTTRGAACDPANSLECGIDSEGVALRCAEDKRCKPPFMTSPGDACDTATFFECGKTQDGTQLRCDETVGLCKLPRVLRGLACDIAAYRECTLDLQCRDALCKPPTVGRGEVCDLTDLVECSSDLECRDSYCKPLKVGRGKACSATDLLECETGLECRGNVCKPPRVTAVGGRCSESEFLECALGFQCEQNTCSEPIACSNAPYTSFVAALAKPLTACVLNLTNQGPVALTQDIEKLQNLEQLQAVNAGLTSLPAAIGKLKKLKLLDVRANKLSSLPNEFINMGENAESALTILLGQNKLSELPINFGLFVKPLKQLDLSSNTLLLPESFGSLTITDRLELDSMRLTSLPESFGRLRLGSAAKPADLLLQFNELNEGIPTFGSTMYFNLLDLSYNQLRAIPSWMNSLKGRVRELNLEANPLAIDDVEKLRVTLGSGTLVRFERKEGEYCDLRLLCFSKIAGGLECRNTRCVPKLSAAVPAVPVAPGTQGAATFKSFAPLAAAPVSLPGTAVSSVPCTEVTDLVLASRNPLGVCQLAISGKPIAQWLGTNATALKNLEVLQLDHSDLTTVRPVAMLPKLTVLRVFNNGITSLPMELSTMGRSSTRPLGLNFAYNKLTVTALDSLALIKPVQYLYLRGNLFDRLPTSLATLVIQERLDLAENKLTSVAFGNLSLGTRAKSASLDLSSNRLSSLPADAFGPRMFLSTVDLSNNRFSTVPLAALATLSGRVESIRLTGNPLSPEQLAALKKALPRTTIEFGAQQFQVSVASCLFAERCAAGLECRYDTFANATRCMPPLLTGRCRAEPYRSFTEAQEEADPARVCHLDLSGQSIDVLPEEIGEFTRLKSLDLSSTGLKSLSEEIGALGDLQTLILKKNNLTRFPDTITRLRQLQLLDLSRNTLLPAEQHRIQQLLPWLSTDRLRF